MPFALARWLGDEADPRDLMRPFPAGQMRMWPISTRVNKCGADRTGAGRGVGKRAAAETDAWSRTHRFALRRFLDFLAEALREATVL
jgi:hypothetical protein